MAVDYRKHTRAAVEEMYQRLKGHNLTQAEGEMLIDQVRKRIRIPDSMESLARMYPTDSD